MMKIIYCYELTYTKFNFGVVYSQVVIDVLPSISQDVAVYVVVVF